LHGLLAQLPQSLDDVRAGERLARAGDAEQNLVPFAVAQPPTLLDGLERRTCWGTEDFKAFGCIARRDEDECY
jgi:hypothetical protein